MSPHTSTEPIDPPDPPDALTLFMERVLPYIWALEAAVSQYATPGTLPAIQEHIREQLAPLDDESPPSVEASQRIAAMIEAQEVAAHHG